MTSTPEQRRTAYKKLSPEVQSFIMDNEITEIISSYLEETGLSEDENNLADSEILNAMFGLQTLSDAINNIANLSSKDLGSLSELRKNLEDNIFTELNKIKSNSKEESRGNQNRKEENKDFAPNSYEQILINQAKAMRPVGITPDNLPTEESRSLNPESSRKEEKGVIHNSIGYTGSDPYREPAE